MEKEGSRISDMSCGKRDFSWKNEETEKTEKLIAIRIIRESPPFEPDHKKFIVKPFKQPTASKNCMVVGR